LLLHFQRSDAHIHRDELMRRLREHINGYHKGRADVFAATYAMLDVAYANADRLRTRGERPGENPSTEIDTLVRLLTTLRD
jgi:hypothetical protein